MIESIIRRAIIWAITVAIVAGVTSAITNATRNAMSKSLEKRITELGIDKDNIENEDLSELIDVNVVRRGVYIIDVQENVYGLFNATYTAKNKDDAIRKVGKKIFGFVNVNKDILTNEQKDFYMRVWFETLGKEKYTQKLEKIDTANHELITEIQYTKNRIQSNDLTLDSLINKMLKAQTKGKLKKLAKIEIDIDYYKKENVKEKAELAIRQKEQAEIQKQHDSFAHVIKHPEFDYKKMTLKGLSIA